jgi:single-strand DNA-binding protein
MNTGLNRVTLFGNLGAEPELRTTGTGLPVMSFRLATNEVWFDKDQNKQEKTEWHRIVMFGSRATPLSRMLTKGERVLVEGRLQTSSYEKDGVKRYKTEIVASDVCFGSRGARSISPPPAGSFSAPATAGVDIEDNVPF